jgi:hypothetical protein
MGTTPKRSARQKSPIVPGIVPAAIVREILDTANDPKNSVGRKHLRAALDAPNKATRDAAIGAAREPLWYLRQVKSVALFGPGVPVHLGTADIDGAYMAQALQDAMLQGDRFGRCEMCARSGEARSYGPRSA